MQQQLLEPPPTRRIIVSRSSGVAHWGIDVSVHRLAVAYVASDHRRGARTASYADLDGGARLAHIWSETARFVTWLIEDRNWPWPGLVWIEQPSGARPNPPLSYATGVIIGAVHSALEQATGAPVASETVASSKWKLAATGYGGHRKPTKKSLGRTPEFLDYGVARWAQSVGYNGLSWDEADALGIAEAARRTVALDPR